MFLDLGKPEINGKTSLVVITDKLSRLNGKKQNWFHNILLSRTAGARSLPRHPKFWRRLQAYMTSVEAGGHAVYTLSAYMTSVEAGGHAVYAL